MKGAYSRLLIVLAIFLLSVGGVISHKKLVNSRPQQSQPVLQENPNRERERERVTLYNVTGLGEDLGGGDSMANVSTR